MLGSDLEFVNSFCISNLLREVVVRFGATVLEAFFEFHSFRCISRKYLEFDS